MSPITLSPDELRFVVSLPVMSALTGAVVAGGIASIAARRARQREDRKPLGRAIAHLLEVHWFMFIYEGIRTAGAASDVDIAKKFVRSLKFAAPAALPRAEDLERSYAEAVERVAEVAPILAFELRDKIHIRALYAKLGETAKVPGPEADLAEVVGDIAMTRALPAMERIILEVAKRFGRREHREIRAHFNELRRRLKAAPELIRTHNAAIAKAK